MKLKYRILIILALSWVLSASPLFARESYTITGAQISSLSANLTTLKDLTIKLRLKLDSYKQALQATAQELQVSQLRLEKAENESNTFILRLSNQQTMLTEQSKSLSNAKTSSKRLRRKDKAKNILFAIIIGALATRR